MLADLLNTPVTILRRSASGEDEYGDETTQPEEIETVGAVQKQARRGGSGEEPESEGEISDTRWVGFFPIGTELDTGDAIRVEGIGVLELVGAPWEAKEGSEEVWHVEVPLRRIAGSEDK